MQAYLNRFHEKLKQRYQGSLVRVKTVKEVEPNAKEYTNKLAKAGLIERGKWGWYWIPDEVKDVWDFLKKDRNFKVASAQTAASFWNYDFVHRDILVLKVKDRSYGKALEAFAKRKGWNIQIDYVKEPSEARYIKIGKLLVEDAESTIIECVQNWAFTDGFAVLYSNRGKIKLKQLSKRGYWKRISGTDVRVRQALEYGCRRANEMTGEYLFPVKEARLDDEFLRREIDEAVERVVELG
jgi:hypothetical protein